MSSCSEKTKTNSKTPEKELMSTMQVNDDRISLELNPMQKRHQLENMRSHLKAVQVITNLIANEDFDKASKLAYSELGSTTEMRLMCASFGNKNFENLGVAFHASADSLSTILKTKNQKKSLKALSKTLNYCVQCHATYRQ